MVPTDAPGFSSQEIHGKLGLRSSDTASLALDGVEVPDEAMLGEPGEGFKIAMSALDNGRYSVAAGCVGICTGCVEASVSYAKERKQFDVPLARFQLVQAMIAEMIVKRDAARLRSRLRELGVRKGHWIRVERPVSGWGSLTDCERRVAGAVAEGLTNRQAAERLFLSRHTVDFHLRQIFLKLDIGSRVELTRLVLQHD